MAHQRTTLQDIAKVCKCSTMTVSLALRNDASISEKRRAQIRAVAKQLDYTPDPALSALAAYRRTHYPKATATPLAWITNYPTLNSWNRVQSFDFVKSYFKGTTERAKEIGYHIEHFWLREPGMTPRRLSGILYSRGISGILLAPQPIAFAHLNMQWDRFSSVTFGYSLRRPRLHMTTTHHYRSVSMLMRKLLSLGYRRIGFALNSLSGARTHHNYYASFIVEQARLPAKYRVPPLYVPAPSSAALLKWYRAHRPEVVITGMAGALYDVLRGEGLRIPQDVGLASLYVQAESLIGGLRLSGADENYPAVGAAAVDLLVTLLHRNEKGVPSTPRSVLIDSKWVEGSTVRRINIEKRPAKLYK